MKLKQSVVDDGATEQFLLDNNSIANFTRFRRDNRENYGELQTAVVSYIKKFPRSPLQPFLQVDLVSTIHIADKEYFTILQKELETYDRVLYEMVASEESSLNIRNPSATKWLKVSRSWGFFILGFIQRHMAWLLMLDLQLDCLDYLGENWYHADLDHETFNLLQLERGESFFTIATTYMMPSTWRSKLLWASLVLLPVPLTGFFIIGIICAEIGNQASEYPDLEALARLDFVAAMKVFWAKSLTSEFTQVTADVEDTSVIIGERNRVVTEALRRSMDEGHNRIAVLYGADHMPDLGTRLRKEFDLVPSRVQWITAWSIRNRVFASRYLGLLLFSSVLALDLWFWPKEVFNRLGLLQKSVNWLRMHMFN